MISGQIMKVMKKLIDEVLIYRVKSQKTFPLTTKLYFIDFIDFI
jgi:hypothetical protein